MRKLLYSVSAQQDIGEIRKYIRRQSRNDNTARAFVDVLQQQCQKLAALPGTLGRPRPEIRSDLRSFPYKNYIIFFRYLPEFSSATSRTPSKSSTSWKAIATSPPISMKTRPIRRLMTNH